MVKLYDEGIFLVNGEKIVPESQAAEVEDFTGYPADKARNAKGTIAYQILRKHNQSGSMEHLKLKFDAMASHDITYVGIIQTARASGMDKFPLPYVLTCCHNSLCAVGGTINDDDHLFGLSAAKKYGGIYVPPHIAVIHQYMRENFAGCGKMILGSDSHTRYGALGTMAIGEGGGELDKQLLGDTYDIDYPGVVAIYLDGAPQPFVGPQDIALAIIGAVYKSGYVKNKVMEFVGPGVATMTTDYRNGIDVMTTETTCLSSVWRTDDDTRKYLLKHHRDDDFKCLNPADIAYYDGCVYVDLSTIKPMIALPFHPSNAYEIDELNANLEDILRETEKSAEKVAEGRASFTLLDKIADDGRLQTQQGVIAGCAGGTYTNVVEAAHALKGANIGNGEFYLSVYPSSQPVLVDLDRKGLLADLMDAGAIVRTAFCGPCFGAGDTPANNALSIRHATRNFPNREGSRPGDGQLSGVILMDARSIAATARNHGALTPATDIDYVQPAQEKRTFDRGVYAKRVYFGFGRADRDAKLRYGPNITEWPEIPALADNLLLRLAAVIHDEVTTTDELIPSGETSSYRSNPMKLAQFALSRRVPEYVPRTGKIRAIAESPDERVFEALKAAGLSADVLKDTHIGSVIFACRPGDGSAREQAASCQRVLGGAANICYAFATKRYRSNCINWGMLPLTTEEDKGFDYEPGDWVWIPNVREQIAAGADDLPAVLIGKNGTEDRVLHLNGLTDDEREILLSGCLMNFYRERSKTHD